MGPGVNDHIKYMGRRNGQTLMNAVIWGALSVTTCLPSPTLVPVTISLPFLLPQSGGKDSCLRLTDEHVGCFAQADEHHKDY